MGEILGMGCTHTGLGGNAVILRDQYAGMREQRRAKETTPPDLKDQKNWPVEMQRELGEDNGLAAAEEYWASLLKGFREARKAIEDFNPDFVLIWGDDQYEAIQEDLMTAFTIFNIPEIELKRRVGYWWSPEHSLNGGSAIVPRMKVHTTAATHVTGQLIRKGFEVAGSWRLPHGESVSHAFTNTVDYLSFDGQGFPWPVVPVAVNCYGVDLYVPQDKFPIPQSDGGMPNFKVTPPPSPPPWRCYDLGKAIGQIIDESPWRAVLIGSSSWSHASLTKKHHYLWPDIEADRARKQDLETGNFAHWRDLSGEQLVSSGQHEFLNWVCLAGAMEGRRPEILAHCESFLFNSTRIVAKIPAAARAH